MLPLLIDINGPEFVLLLVLAIILFGPEKLPELARKAARVLRYLRGIAGSAQEQLSRELGPGYEDLDLRDLNPKAFVQKHLLSDVDPIVADVKAEFADLKGTVSSSSADMASAINGKPVTSGGPQDLMASATPTPAPRLTPFDLEAT